MIKEIKTMDNIDLMFYSIDYICKSIISKSDQYMDAPNFFQIFARIITNLGDVSSLIQDVFFMLLVFKCPYICQIEIKKADFKGDEEGYKKRMGFSNPDETFPDFFKNMECYSYLYFSFISQNKKHFPIIKEFLDRMSIATVNYAISAVFKVFLNVLGNQIKESFPEGVEQMTKIAQRMIKETEALNKKSTNTDCKSICINNIYRIKEYMKSINKGEKTDMYQKKNKK